MNSERHTVTLTKLTQRSLREGIVDKDQAKLVENIISTSRSSIVAGWSFEAGGQRKIESESEEYEWQYEYDITVIFEHATREPEPEELANLVRKIASKASAPQIGNRWTLSLVDDTKYQPHVVEEDGEDTEELGYAPVAMPADFDRYFDHLYGLDSQILRVRRSIETGIESHWSKRAHCALVGPPACGKSDIATTLKAALGDEAVWALDGTAMTEAGVIKQLSERDILPRVIVIEEAEKATEDSLRPLLGMLDTRGEVRKVTARGAVQRDTKVVAIVTVNDYSKFKRMLSGALASRCGLPIFFKRPSREVLTRILEREVTDFGGDLGWIKPTLDFCDEHNISDPRQAINICLTGREMLLTGEYQQALEETMCEEEV